MSKKKSLNDTTVIMTCRHVSHRKSRRVYRKPWRDQLYTIIKDQNRSRDFDRHGHRKGGDTKQLPSPTSVTIDKE